MNHQEKSSSDTLTPQQEGALTSLLMGSTQQEAAAAAGVTPETVSRWINHDYAFVAAHNARRRELWEITRNRRATLMIRALEALEELLDSDNEKIRLEAARTLARPLPAPDGPTDAQAVEWHKAAEREKALWAGVAAELNRADREKKTTLLHP